MRARGRESVCVCEREIWSDPFFFRYRYVDRWIESVNVCERQSLCVCEREREIWSDTLLVWKLHGQN